MGYFGMQIKTNPQKSICVPKRFIEMQYIKRIVLIPLVLGINTIVLSSNTLFYVALWYADNLLCVILGPHYARSVSHHRFD